MQETAVLCDALLGQQFVARVPSAALELVPEMLLQPAEVACKIEFTFDKDEGLYCAAVSIDTVCTCACVVCGEARQYTIANTDQVYILDNPELLPRYQHLQDVHLCENGVIRYLWLLGEQLCLSLPTHPQHENCANVVHLSANAANLC